MPHARRLIITAAVAALQPLMTAGTVTAIKPGRAAPMPVAKAPYILVYGRRERSGPLAGGGVNRKLQRELTLAIEAVTASADDNDEQVDQICAAVEAALAATPTLGGLAKDLVLTATDLDARAEGETRTGRARLEFIVQYVTVASAPEMSV